MKDLILSESGLMTMLLLGFIALAVTLLYIWISRISEDSSRLLGNTDAGHHSVGFFNHDLRRYKRIPCNVPIQVFDRSGMIPSGSGHMLNLSETGACVNTTFSQFIGDHFVARMLTSYGGTTRIAGRIVWVRPEGAFTTYGIEF